MPHILRDINPIAATLLTQHRIFYDRAIIIVGSHSNIASQDNERLILCWVPMDGYHSPWLHRIQHPMTFILQRLYNSSLPVRPILSLKDSARLMHLNTMPSPLRNLNPELPLPGTNPEPRHLLKAASSAAVSPSRIGPPASTLGNSS